MGRGVVVVRRSFAVPPPSPGIRSLIPGRQRRAESEHPLTGLGGAQYQDRAFIP